MRKSKRPMTAAAIKRLQKLEERVKAPEIALKERVLVKVGLPYVAVGAEYGTIWLCRQVGGARYEGIARFVLQDGEETAQLAANAINYYLGQPPEVSMKDGEKP